MRLAVLSDVHANLPALEAALAALEREDVDAFVCAGDLVGYGPLPNETVARVAALDPVAVAGNHDLIVLGRLTDAPCTPFARESLEWTRGVLDDAARAYLDALPQRRALGELVVAHGGLDDPWRYVRTDEEAARELAGLGRHAAATVLVLGHTHRAAAWHDRRGRLATSDGALELPREGRTLLNPGSVGHSRAWRPLARFLVLDLERRVVRFRAVRYDAARCRDELRRRGRPPGSCHDRPRPLRAAAGRLRGRLA